MAQYITRLNYCSPRLRGFGYCKALSNQSETAQSCYSFNPTNKKWCCTVTFLSPTNKKWRCTVTFLTPTNWKRLAQLTRVADPVHFRLDPDPANQNFKNRNRILLAIIKIQFKHLHFLYQSDFFRHKFLC